MYEICIGCPDRKKMGRIRKNGIVPFIIDEDLKLFYYRGLHEWNTERGYLIDTCLSAQDKFRKYLDYFRIPYQR